MLRDDSMRGMGLQLTRFPTSCPRCGELSTMPGLCLECRKGEDLAAGRNSTPLEDALFFAGCIAFLAAISGSIWLVVHLVTHHWR
jgi:hypothetical protein